jgi:hypothetical protein
MVIVMVMAMCGVVSSSPGYSPRRSAIVVIAALILALLCGVRAEPARAQSVVFFAGYNLGGPSIVVDGNTWSAGSSVTYNGYDLGNPWLPFAPSPSAAQKLVVDDWVQHWEHTMTVAAANGSYEAYVWWVVSDAGDANTVTAAVEGAAVSLEAGGMPVGSWARVGPVSFVVSDGEVVLTTTGGLINLAGLELWSVVVEPTSTPTSTATNTPLPGTDTPTNTPVIVTVTPGPTVTPSSDDLVRLREATEATSAFVLLFGTLSVIILGLIFFRIRV